MAAGPFDGLDYDITFDSSSLDRLKESMVHLPSFSSFGTDWSISFGTPETEEESRVRRVIKETERSVTQHIERTEKSWLKSVNESQDE